MHRSNLLRRTGVTLTLISAALLPAIISACGGKSSSGLLDASSQDSGGNVLGLPTVSARDISIGQALTQAWIRQAIAAGAHIQIDCTAYDKTCMIQVANAPPLTTGLAFQWDFGDGTSAEGLVVQHTFPASQSYTVVLSIFESASGATAFDQATANPVDGLPLSDPQTVVVTAGAAGGSQTNPPPAPPASSSPAPLPMPPPPGRIYAGYMEDGGYHVQDGIAAPTPFQQMAIACMPKLGRYGVKRWLTAEYIGMARSVADAHSYFDPLVAAGRANGIKFIPGFWAHSIIEAVYGATDEAPWNAPPWNLKRGDIHPMNPSALGQQAYWDEFVKRAEILSQGAQSDQVYVDGEFVYRQMQDDPFWTDANIAIVRTLASAAVDRLRREGIFLLMFHPMVNPSWPNLVRIAQGIYAPQDPSDSLATIEHLFEVPGVTGAPYRLMTQDEITAVYLAHGFYQSQLRYGFYYDSINYGYTPTQYDAYCTSRPDVVDVSWYCTPNFVISDVANQLDAIAAGRGH